MISESHYWKSDLLKQAQSLRRRTNQKRWTETSSARVEQAIMLGFYAVRKLIEAKKLSDDVANQSLGLITHPWRGKAVTRINRFDYWELYDLDKSRTVSRSLAFLCNQVIHSYLFALSFDDANSLDGVLVASDRERNQALYFIRSQQIVELFEQVGNDYPNAMDLEFDERGQDYTVRAKTISRI
jgi:hypothetical protein